MTSSTKGFVWTMTPIEFIDRVVSPKHDVRDSDGNIMSCIAFMDFVRNCRLQYLDRDLMQQYHSGIEKQH